MAGTGVRTHAVGSLCLRVQSGPSFAAPWMMFRMPSAERPSTISRFLQSATATTNGKFKQPVPRGMKSSRTSSEPPLLLSFKRGKYKLNLPLESGGISAPNKRQTAFSFHSDITLKKVKASIREEGASRVEFVGPNGEALPDEDTVGDAAWHGGFNMKLDGKEYAVLATRAGGYVDDGEEGGGRTELPSLLERGKVIRLRAALNDETRRIMTYAEFEGLCKDCGMDKADARKVAADLHTVGVILHFHKEPGLAGYIYLQPHQVLEHFFSEYDLESPLRQYLLRRADRLAEDKDAVQRELQPALSLKKALDGEVKKRVSRVMWGMSAAVVTGAGGYWYLSYVYLSWDIMEPVTFFTALGVSTVSYAWWMFTNKNYQYSHIFDVFFTRMAKRKYESGGLDEARIAELQAELKKFEGEERKLQARIFELECMRDKGLTPCEVDDLVRDGQQIVSPNS